MRVNHQKSKEHLLMHMVGDGDEVITLLTIILRLHEEPHPQSMNPVKYQDRSRTPFELQNKHHSTSINFRL